MRGYLTNDAQIIGVESRTSSPVKNLHLKKHWSMFLLKNYFHAQKAQAMQAEL